jgi:hypothetical protein
MEETTFTASILNKQSWTADKGWYSSLGVGLTTHCNFFYEVLQRANDQVKEDDMDREYSMHREKSNDGKSRRKEITRKT